MGSARYALAQRPPEGSWLGRVLKKKPRLVVAVAPVNCIARVDWALMTKGMCRQGSDSFKRNQRVGRSRRWGQAWRVFTVFMKHQCTANSQFSGPRRLRLSEVGRGGEGMSGASDDPNVLANTLATASHNCLVTTGPRPVSAVHAATAKFGSPKRSSASCSPERSLTEASSRARSITVDLIRRHAKSAIGSSDAASFIIGQARVTDGGGLAAGSDA